MLNRICFLYLMLAIGSVVRAESLSMAKYSGIHHVFGEEISLLEEAYSQLRIEINWMDIPLKRSMIMVDSGELDAELFRIEAAMVDLHNVLKIDVPIGTYRIFAYSLEANHFSDISDLNGKTVANVRGSKIGHVIESRYQMENIEVNDILSVFKMVSSGRVDYVIYSERVTDDILSQSTAFGNIRKVPVLLFEVPAYHYINKRHAALVPKLERVLALLIRAQGVE